MEPDPRADLFAGPFGSDHAPKPDVVYKLVERESGGFSPKVDVRGPDGTKWGVKMGSEAQAEVTSSRIVWAVGYRQPPSYYLRQWRIADEDGVHAMGPGRFRPDLQEVDDRGSWSWHANPFVDTVQFRGLIVLMMILNSTDLKADNNQVYRVRGPGGASQDWYTVKDLGATLGETGRLRPRRNDVALFEKQRFITGVEDGRVRFAYRGGHRELIRNVSPADVGWICRRLRALTDQQWRDAFRAGGYDAATTERYLRKLNEKIAQGLAVAKGGRP